MPRPFPRGKFEGVNPPSKFYDKHRFLLGRIHYYLGHKTIKKRNGKPRRIVIPRGPLKEAQRIALDYLMNSTDNQYPIKLLSCQTAYKRNCSALTNAKRHVGYNISVKFDLKDFFDNIPAQPKDAAKLLRKIRMRQKQRMLESLRRRGKIQPGNKITVQYTSAWWNSRLQRRGRASRSRFMQFVPNVHSALVKAGIAKDIAAWISDIGSYRGFLYQGSVLSPLLSNLVTKTYLCPRLLKLGRGYDLPLWSINGNAAWFVIDRSNAKVFTHTCKSRKPLTRVMKQVAEVFGYAHEPMQKLTDETDKEMLLRYANAAWIPRTELVARLTWAMKQSPKISKYLAKNAEPRIKLDPMAKTMFTLYADDGMFSSNNKELGKMKYVLRNVIEDSGFLINEAKVKVMRGNRRRVTGYEVAHPPEGQSTARIPFKVRKQKYRHPLHLMKWGKIPITESTVRSFGGKLAHLKRSNSEHYVKFRHAFRLIVAETKDDQLTKLAIDLTP